MSTNVTTDHTKSFEEAYALSGVLVTIDGTADIEAIQPNEIERSQEFDSDGTNQSVLTGSITVKTADLPTISVESTVTLDSIVYRITDINTEGKICKTLELESP